MSDSCGILLDNGTGIQIDRNIMAGGSDELDPSSECLMLWLGSDKRGQERVVDVDDVVGITGDEVLG